MATPSINRMPNVNEFISRLNSVITTCRDILRREGITGMDSMKHMTMYILARTLDCNECHRLHISTDFAWEKFLELAAADRKQDCYNLLYNSNGTAPDLITHLDSKFGTKNFNFKLKGPDNHVAIIKHLDSLENFRQIDGVADILGTVYEHHLGSGSNKSAMRDLGQFFTDRRVCNYMTNLCNPRMVSNGIAESVLDPTMGTGGFLTSYVKHLTNQGHRIDWTKMQQDIAGYDIDEFVMSIGRINMYLSTGVIFDRITHRNTLQTDVGDRDQRMNFKVILANEPFGVKGLLYKECCQRVKDMGIDGTKSEPLFLNLMMAALDDGGRCAVVVPDGVLTNDSKQHTGTRKYLMEHFELRRVIKMKGQFFSNTPIQPSILYFENTGKPTSVVEFWEVEQDKTGAVIENMLLSVGIERFDVKYSLDVRQYEEKKALVNTGGFPVMKLGDICKVQTGDYITKVTSEDGEYPIYGGGGAGKCISKFNRENEFVISKDAVSQKCVRFVNGKFFLNHHGWTFEITNDDVLYKYLGYWLIIHQSVVYDLATGSAQKGITQEDFNTVEIPVPPRPIQQEIATALDLIYTNAESARKSADAVKVQMAAVMRSIAMRGYEQKAIQEVCDYKNGSTLDKAAKNEEGEFNVMGGGMDYVGKYNKFNREGYTITISKSGASAGFIKEHEEKFWAGDCFSIYPKSDSLDQKYLYYILKLDPKITTSKITGSTIPHCKWSDIADSLICVPPLSTQQEVLTMLSAMEAERATLEQMAAKGEERAKYILDNYLSSVP